MQNANDIDQIVHEILADMLIISPQLDRLQCSIKSVIQFQAGHKNEKQSKKRSASITIKS